MKHRIYSILLVLAVAVCGVPALTAQHTSATYVETITKATPGANGMPAVTVASSLNPSQYTQQVILTSTVPPLATGTVTFMDGAATLGTGTIASGSTTFATTSLGVGSHTITASYSGDSSFNTAASSAVTQVVNKASSSTALSSSSLSVSYGSGFTLTATLSPSTGTGTVQFMSGDTSLGSASVVGGSAALTLPSLPAGVYSITAIYSGDGNYVGSTSTAVNQTVNPVLPAVTLASSLNPSAYSSAVTFTATVPGAATGTITFMDGATSIGSSTINSGTASMTTTTLITGFHSITASYSGDSNYQAATSNAISQVVSLGGTVSEISATPAGSITVGSSVTFTSLVDTAGAASTGNVTFMDGATTLGTASVSNVSATNLLPYSNAFAQWTVETNGVAAPTVTANAANGPDGSSNTATQIAFPDTSSTGSHGLDYAGVFYNVSTGNYASQSGTYTLWVKSAAAGSVSLYLADGSRTVNHVTDCATSSIWTRCNVSYTFPSNAAPGFTVSVRSWGAAAETVELANAQFEQAATAGPYILTTGTSATGTGETATLSTSALLDGAHSITAVYSGDSNYATSVSNPSIVTVNKGASAVSVTSSAITANYGSSVTFTASVTGPENPPTGTVTFMDGATTIGSGTLNSSGVATFTTSVLLAGSHSITAVYGGDSQLTTATSSALTQTIQAVAANLNVTASANPAVFGTTVTFTVHVTATGVTPTGTVTIGLGGTTLGTITLDGTGAGTFTTSTLAVGSDSLTFTYSGDSNYL